MDEIDGEQFHGQERGVYDGPIGPAVVKRRTHMAHVRYRATHYNPEESGDRRGHGLNHAVWIFAEEPGVAEGLFESSFELMMDSRLEPGAAIGMHRHDRSEEIYYVLEGTLAVTTVDAGGVEHGFELGPGDAHLVRRGQSHCGRAGPDGARLIVVAMRV